MRATATAGGGAHPTATVRTISARDVKANDHQRLVQRLIDAINNRTYAVLPELIHPDYVYRTPGQELRGVEALVGLLSHYHQAFPDLQLSIQEMFGEGEKVATTFILTGTHQGELMGVPATGNPVSIHGTIHSRSREGKIVEEWELLDLWTLNRQLGRTGVP